MAELINNHLCKNNGNSKSFNEHFQTGSVINKFKKYPIPINIVVMESRLCKVNDGVFKAMDDNDKRLNGDLHLVETLNAQAIALEKLIDLQAAVKRSDLSGK